jgi:hypothetical protein
MKCQQPYINNTHLYIPFQWNDVPIRSGLLTFSVSKSALSPLQPVVTDHIIFDPFLSKPYEFEGLGIDWIKLAYLDKEPAINKLEDYIRGLRIFDKY